MRAPVALTAYSIAARAASPFANLFLDWRARRGKEEPARRGERLGHASEPRPSGPLVWMHGASVGETLSLLQLVERFRARHFHVLMTSGTVTSASLMQRRLPAGAIHQYVPLDSPMFARRFLGHWRPDVVLFAESEIWPNLIVEARRSGAPVMLVNARMSERSYQRWRRVSPVIGSLLGQINCVFAQSDGDAFRFGALGAPRVMTSGNLKFDGPPPPADAMKLAALSAAVAGRPLWLAASTHEGEDEFIIAAHRTIAGQLPDILTIIVPRHPERGAAIADLAASEGVPAAQRSRSGLPGRDIGVYVADTLGEMGIFYRLTPIAFVGKSLAAEGGQNPIEPAKLGVAILHGPNVQNFSDTYAALDRDAGALIVNDADEMARAAASLIMNPGALRAMGQRALQTVDALAGATEKTFREIESYLPQAERL